jgi:imidazole glycerol-phosphate synthase subunit HisH
VIALVDYGAGNINSVKKAFVHLGAEVEVVSTPAALQKAAKIVFPGVGHFSALRALDTLGLRGPLMETARGNRPLLGICVGMQWLFAGSEEAPEIEGAGIFSGQCRQFAPPLKSPHVGWNSLAIRGASRLLRGLAHEPFVYYTHSFHAPVVPETAAATEYGFEFSGVVERGNVFGVQFHPEKSGDIGLEILKNFCEVETC